VRLNDGLFIIHFTHVSCRAVYVSAFHIILFDKIPKIQAACFPITMLLYLMFSLIGQTCSYCKIQLFFQVKSHAHGSFCLVSSLLNTNPKHSERVSKIQLSKINKLLSCAESRRNGSWRIKHIFEYIRP